MYFPSRPPGRIPGVSARSCRGTVRVDAVEGLVFLVVTLVVVAALAVGLASARRQIDDQHDATSTTSRRLSSQLDESAAIDSALSSTLPLPVTHQAGAAITERPTLASHESRSDSRSSR